MDSGWFFFFIYLHVFLERFKLLDTNKLEIALILSINILKDNCEFKLCTWYIV